MTRLFNDQWQCPSCGVKHAKETLFKQWVRAHPGIESTEGFVVYDCDQIIHRYKTYDRNGRTRELQCIMLVEIKTYGAEPEKAQRDTLGLMGQFLRNRRQNIHKSKGRRQVEASPNRAYSIMLNREIDVRAYGYHLLQFEKDGPQNSIWMKWDSKLISEDQLVSILRFDLDPDSLRPIDFRLHHEKPKTLKLL